jgi:hypothetical protein
MSIVAMISYLMKKTETENLEILSLYGRRLAVAGTHI